MNINMKFFDTVDSTNSVLKDLAIKGAEPGTVVVSRNQTAGRGRLGRTFVSPEGGIYMSILLPFDKTMTITAKAAVAVKRAILEITGKRTLIKWVNDLFLDGKKVCGILAEAVGNSIVLGIGINYSSEIKNFPPELRNLVSSLYNDPEQKMADSIILVNAVIREIIGMVENNEDDWLGEYKASSFLIGKKVNIIQAETVVGSGTVTEIDNNCALHIMDKGVEIILSTGEVSIREK